MSRRDLSQPSFVDAMVSGYGKVGGFLDRIDKAFDWPAFEALLAPIHASTRGAPGYPPLVMFKILLVQQWHTLTDPGRRRRCGTGCRSAVSAACRWRRRRPTTPRSGGSARRSTSSAFRRRCFWRPTGNSMGSASSSSAARWSDATLIEAAVKRPAYGSGGVNPRDPDARVTMKRKTVHFGYKAHLAVDEESGLVRQAEMTPAHVHDARLARSADPGRRAGLFRRQGL